MTASCKTRDRGVLGLLSSCGEFRGAGAEEPGGAKRGGSAGQPGRSDWHTKGPESRLNCLRRLFGPKAGAPFRYLDLDWSVQEWTRGCYGGNAAPGALTRFGSALRGPVGPIHWPGSETAHRWIGYMEGAIEAVERAAEEALADGSGAGDD